MKKFVLSNAGQDRQTYQIEYRKLLNDAQHRAVMHGSGPLLVVAGAGTGKTRTLIYRLARLIENGVPPESILLLTFTRRSAAEMLKRASLLLDDRCRRVEGGTFHHICSTLLRRHAKRIGYPEQFGILDASDAMEVIQLLRSRFVKGQGTTRFPKKSTLYSIFSASVNRQMDLQAVLEEEYPQFLKQGDRIADLMQAYQEYKFANHVMDFDDLLVRTTELLTDHDDVRREVAAAYQHVMVDEYQDTNAIQAHLTKLFSSVHGNVMAVGDDAQSIYSFRGADVQNMHRFPELFPNTTIIRLEENYRSTGNILTFANRVLSESDQLYEKELYTRKEDGDLPGLVKAANMNDQSRFVTQMILRLREQGLDLNQIAVLFRNGRDSYDLEAELNRLEIPFVKYGGQKFTEAAHVKDVLAHLRIYINPKDALSWNRALTLIDGIGPKTAEELHHYVTAQSSAFAPHEMPGVSDRYLRQLKALSDLFATLRELDGSVTEQLRTVVDYYARFCKKRYDDHPKRLKDLETFVDISGTYRTLEQLVEECALDPVEATAIDTEAFQNEEPPLVLSTIHSAKGLEWNTVFLIQCLDGILPSGYAMDDEKQMEEEVRILYVAITRAQESLFLTYPALFQSHYGDYFSNPSRFIEEVPESVLEPWLLVHETSGELGGGESAGRQIEGT
ncbi:MAG: ATP-dependent helicase [Balneolaceae bacterium]